MGIALIRTGAIGLAAMICAAQPSAQLRFCVHTDPATFDPLLAAEEASEAVRYLTGGVLIRVNRRTQQPEPELATSWKVRADSKRIDFVLRPNVRFSDGTPFTSDDVVATFRRITDVNLHSAVADTFRSAGGEIKAQANGSDRVSVSFSVPVAGLELLFDQLAITSAHSQREGAVLGPFMLGEYKSGQYVLLRRNPQYWKTDASGKVLPYLDSVRLDIQSNRETELLRFRNGELHFIDKLEPDAFERLRKEMPSSALNVGPSLDAEFLWFNQNANAPFQPYKKRWFQSTRFRRAVSAAVNRNDIVRLVYHGYASPAFGPLSPANTFWFNSNLPPLAHDPPLALKLLREDGFQFDGRSLRDQDGNIVEFSLITNAGSKTRTQIGTMLQEDLRRIGIRLNFTPIEFQSLIERITRTQQYEACLLGLVNVEIDPNSQMNVWVSSGTHHAWNPEEKKPATPWEAEIDRLMQVQHTTVESKARKVAFDRVQELVAEQAPIVYLVHPSVLVAVSPAVHNAAPFALSPHLYWNVEHLTISSPNRPGRN
jgi:peptide/nickel transport system substrate-binding protein